MRPEYAEAVEALRLWQSRLKPSHHGLVPLLRILVQIRALAIGWVAAVAWLP